MNQNVHAIGDRANAIVLDAFEEALQGANVTALRPRIEHAQMVRHVDMARMGKIGGMSMLLFFERFRYQQISVSV